MQGFLRGRFQRLGRMFLRQCQQTVQHPRADGAALLHHRLGPTAGVRAKQSRPVQQIGLAVFDNAPVLEMQMDLIRGELPRFDAHMDGDDFPPLVENAHQAACFKKNWFGDRNLPEFYKRPLLLAETAG